MPMSEAPAPERVDVRKHIRLAHWAARRFVGRLGGDYDEAFSTALLSLVKAARGWEPDLGTFGTFFYFIARRDLRLAIERKLRGDGVARQDRPFGKFESVHKRAQLHSYALVSLDQRLVEDSDRGLAEIIADESTPDPEAALLAKDEAAAARECIAAALPVLNANERRVVEARFLADDAMTLDELAAEFGGLTKERVRQIEERALEKLHARITGRRKPPKPRKALVTPREKRPRAPAPVLACAPTAAELAGLNDRERRIAEARLVSDAPVSLKTLAAEFGVGTAGVYFAERRLVQKLACMRGETGARLSRA
jgi:RNA polymerase sigma factor (sigma-70 family)